LSDFLGENQLIIERIKAAMDAETHNADTHPSLKDRVDLQLAF
jgi:hypothetical protein